jgi:uracil-DNA glycosylase
MIEAMGFARKDVYIGNIMNWRPEMDSLVGNRPPTYEEMVKCLPYLKAQVAVVRPKVIVALGATATTGLLGPDPDRKMGSTRGHFFDFDGTPIMVTYHPSYLLRNATISARRVVWEDILKVMERVGLPISEKQRKFFT